MMTFRRLREQQATTATISEAIASNPPEDTIEPGTFDQHPPKKRGRQSRRSEATTAEN
jgi:hypothetical protein